jgi:hypothetical protein
MQVDALVELVQKTPTDCFAEIDQEIATITRMSRRVKTLSYSLNYRPLAKLSHPDWCAILHLLAHRTRAHLMGDLATLHPAILHLGDQAAVRGMVDAMREVCQQWK